MNGTITLTSDFGTSSPYVAAMQGVILGINSQVRIMNLCHSIPPQDVHHAAWFLRESLPYFPPEAVHVVVVDPGVGTDRALLYVETTEGQRLLAPDNGVWTWLCKDAPGCVLELSEPQWWRKALSPTFHGRDILAPVAAHLSLGLDPRRLGPQRSSWVQLLWPSPHQTETRIEGEVMFVDSFGNLLTNVPASLLPPDLQPEVHVGERVVRRWVRTYGQAVPGEIVVLISSGGWLEIAQVNGNAARSLGLERNARVILIPNQQPGP
jgi:S-adenosylmethionine hydrolase